MRVVPLFDHLMGHAKVNEETILLSPLLVIGVADGANVVLNHPEVTPAVSSWLDATQFDWKPVRHTY